MAKAVALVITGISIALLVIYGADAAAGMDDPDHQGFLDMDHMTRGPVSYTHLTLPTICSV